MKIEEKVPVRIPMMKTKGEVVDHTRAEDVERGGREQVVILVSMERENTRLIARLMIVPQVGAGFISSSSRIRSKTTMVSLIE